MTALGVSFTDSMRNFQLAMLAHKSGFTIRGTEIKPRWNPQRLSDLLYYRGTIVPLAGARARVLGGGRGGVAVKVTAADGTEIIGVTSRRNLVAAHQFCAMLAGPYA